MDIHPLVFIVIDLPNENVQLILIYGLSNQEYDRIMSCFWTNRNIVEMKSKEQKILTVCYHVCYSERQSNDNKLLANFVPTKEFSS